MPKGPVGAFSWHHFELFQLRTSQIGHPGPPMCSNTVLPPFSRFRVLHEHPHDLGTSPVGSLATSSFGRRGDGTALARPWLTISLSGRSMFLGCLQVKDLILPASSSSNYLYSMSLSGPGVDSEGLVLVGLLASLLREVQPRGDRACRSRCARCAPPRDKTGARAGADGLDGLGALSLEDSQAQLPRCGVRPCQEADLFV